jgi:ornithine cyclodeaminase/alanine dehydrogenase-like protein (mu-crystallin family)
LPPHAVVIAMGADAIGKRELGPDIMRRARAVVADSLAQCRRYGEMQWLEPQAANVTACELGALIAGAETLPAGEGPVIFDSTGVAFQDAIGGHARQGAQIGAKGG